MLARILKWLFSAPPVVVTAEADEAKTPRQSFFTTDMDADRPHGFTIAQRLGAKAFPKTVFDTAMVNESDGGKTFAKFAMDSSDGSSAIKSAYTLNQVGIPDVQATWYGSQGFIGYQLCAILAQHWLVNKACLVPARDAIRKGFKLTVNDGTEVDPKIMAAIKAANKRYKLDRKLVEYVKMGRVFGVRVALCVVDSDDVDYYTKPFNPDSITPGSYRGITQIDPYWCIPELTSASASNPASLDFYEPTYWIINNQRYHKSHLVILRGPEVADILKPSYLYGGLSVPQLIYERVYAAERTANEAPQLALTKRSTIYYTDAAKALANQGKFEQSMSLWRSWLDNYGIKIADKEADKVEQMDTSLADLDAVIMSQYQLVAAIANVPSTKLLGTTPKGFNASGDYETESYHEELESIQTNDMEPLIERHMVCVIRSDITEAFSIKPFNVDVVWEPLKIMSAAELATVNKTKAETAKILAVDIGAVDGEEVRDHLTADENSGFNGLAERVSGDPLEES